MKTPATVEAYITAAPKAARPMLRQLRRAIKAAAPKATEGMSYHIPYYSYYGRLIYFAAYPDHVSLFAWGKQVDRLGKKIEKYRTGKGTLQFPIGTKIPIALVKKIVFRRAKDNEAAKKR